jgi:hypothetical protein
MEMWLRFGAQHPVLRTNTDLNPLEAMLCYKQLWTVERNFQTAKHLLTTVRSSTNSTRSSAHVFCSFLASWSRKALDDRIAYQHSVDYATPLGKLLPVATVTAKRETSRAATAPTSPRHPPPSA